jgi:hypothetical protein
MTQNVDREILDKLPDGPHRIEAVFDIEVYNRSNRPHPAPPITRVSQARRLDFSLVPASTETITLLRDPATQALVEKGVHIGSVEHRFGVVYVNLVVRNLPFDFAADITLRSGDREWSGGIATMNRGSNGGASSYLRVDKSFNPTTVDVTLRGSPDAARTTPHMNTVWGGELTFKEVRIVPPPGALP